MCVIHSLDAGYEEAQWLWGSQRVFLKGVGSGGGGVDSSLTKAPFFISHSSLSGNRTGCLIPETRTKGMSDLCVGQICQTFLGS